MFSRLGVDELFPPSYLSDLLRQSDFVVIAVQWTPKTESLLSSKEFHAMKSSAWLINIARGEIVDQDALIAALRDNSDAGIAGAVLDVYRNEFTEPPPEELWSLPNVLITPHTSGQSDDRGHGRGVQIFAENMKRFSTGNAESMVNIVQWDRGY